MFKNFRESKKMKFVAAFLAVNLLSQLCLPSVAFALTSGPAQEEFASFEPASTSDMVDLFSGDFTYNIPLLSVPGDRGGYPINLSYHSGIGMDQEASWVGLGWNINVGAINRQIQGLPDDFKGESSEANSDYVTKRYNSKLNWTVGLHLDKKTHRERFGSGISTPANPSFQVYYNNNKGIGYRAAYAMSKANSSNSFSAGVSLSYDSQGGWGVNPNLTINGAIGKVNIGISYSGRQGYQGTQVSAMMGGNDRSKRVDRFDKDGDFATKASNGLGGEISGGYSFNRTYDVPTVTIPFKSSSVPFTLRLGVGAANTTYPSFNSPFPQKWAGYYNQSKVANDGYMTAKSYGYLYNGNAGENDVKDFQREQYQYTKHMPNLAPSRFTYDLYSISGQGTGGMFRPYVNNVPILTDGYYTASKSSTARVTTSSRLNDPLLELGASNTPYLNLHLGLGYTFGRGEQTSGAWKDGSYTNTIDDYFGVQPSNQIDYEPYYFQAPGDKVVMRNNLLEHVGGEKPVRVSAQKTGVFLGRRFETQSTLLGYGGEEICHLANAGPFYGEERQERSMHQSMLTFEETKEHGYSSYLYQSNGDFASLANDPHRKKHHIGEFTVLQNDGMRYIYGLAAYNKVKEDRVSSYQRKSGENWNTSVVYFNEGDYKNTDEKFLSQTELTPYAHSWMLTSVLSSDYVDYDDVAGPSVGDHGYWVKFNYTQTSSNYQWRVPYQGANYLAGSENDTKDDKTSFSYGEKEIYFIQSVETKTHVAVFTMSDRKDAIDAANKYAGENERGSNKMKKLDKIDLYTRSDYEKYKNDLSKATPVKTVHFQYDYSRCPNVPNNDGTAEYYDLNKNGVQDNNEANINQAHGKLTLRKIWFTYQKSSRGELSPYVFNYNTPNPAYNFLNVDRWGNYKKNTDVNNPRYGDNYPFTQFPYTEQDDSWSATANKNDNYTPETDNIVAAWTLDEIQLPTGGIFKVQYESDDYAYVEDRQATRMLDIVGFGTQEFFNDSRQTGSSIVNLHKDEDAVGSGTKDDQDIENFRVYFKLEKPVVASDFQKMGYTGNNSLGLSVEEAGQAYVYDHYIRGLKSNWSSTPNEKRIFFNAYVELTQGNWDFVSGYGELALSGHNGSDNIFYGLKESQANSGKFDIGYITFKGDLLDKSKSGDKTSPFRRAALDHLKNVRPELTSSITGVDNPKGIEQIFNVTHSVFQAIGDAASAFSGFNLYSVMLGRCQKMRLNGFSKLRLGDPNFKKYGGGVRVKKFILNDKWGTDPNNANDDYEYGQEYDYTTEQQITIAHPDNPLQNTKTYTEKISSGVAYEPQIGSEESALTHSIAYSESVPTVIPMEQRLSLEEPILSSYYPGAVVGYSKVTVKSINAGQSPHSAAPVSVHEFYTGKDFPVVTMQTDISYNADLLNPLILPFMSWVEKFKIRSQGYTVLLNDMAGKPKSVTVKKLPVNNTAKEEIISRTTFNYFTDPNHSNRISDKVKILNENGQLEDAFIGQTQEMFVDMHENRTFDESYGGEIDFGIASLVPPPFYIMGNLKFEHAETSMKTVVVMKVINKTGILKSQTIETNGSKITTENIAFDAKTGAALLTKVNNEYEDAIYNQTTPAHWYYAGMDAAYQNQGIVYQIGANASFDNNGLLTVSGTNLLTPGDELALTDNPSQKKAYVLRVNGNEAYLIDKDGHAITGFTKAKVLRSGHRNLLSANVGGVSSKGVNAQGTVDYTKVINASAVEYSDRWQTWALSNANGASSCACNYTAFGNTMLEIMKNTFVTQGGGISGKNGYYFTKGDRLIDGISNELVDIKLYTALRQQFVADKYIWSCNYSQGEYVMSNSIAHIVIKDASTAQVLVEFDLKSPIGFGIYAFTQKLYDDMQAATVLSGPIGISESYTTIAKNFVINSTGCDFTSITFDRDYGFKDIQFKGKTFLFPNENDRITISNSTIPLVTCSSIQNNACKLIVSQSANPFVEGIRGNFLPKKSYAYIDERNQNAVLNAASDLRNEGTFATYSPFNWLNPQTNSNKWVAASEVTKVTPYGFEVENKDALGIYSAAQYGYNNVLPVAVGNNLKYKEIAFDGFEDYSKEACSAVNHFKFEDYQKNVVVGVAHTGNYSMRIDAASSVSVSRALSPSVVSPVNDETSGEYKLKAADNLLQFSPNSDNSASQTFVLSAWVKGDEAVPVGFNITVGGTQIIPDVVTTSVSIEGWKKMDVRFTIPANSSGNIVVSVSNNSTSPAYVDDIRIHPFDANIKSFVYDINTLKPLAELDENNFATFYVYDAEGQLIKVKKETIDGVKTISEGRTNTVKK